MSWKQWFKREGGGADPQSAVRREVALLFERELARRGIVAPAPGSDGTYVVEVEDGWTRTISLENVARDFARDRDSGRIGRFVDTILGMSTPLPPWPEARRRLRFAAEPSDHDFGDTLQQQVSDSLCRVLVYADDPETRITWLTPSLLEDWGISEADAEAAAAENMAALLRETPIEVESVDQFRLGMFSTHSAFKASLIFSPNLKEVLSGTLGWPIYAVIPCRDFAYVFPDEDLIGRVGRVVVDEYLEGAYPLSTEVFHISDDGIEAIGEFPVVTE